MSGFLTLGQGNGSYPGGNSNLFQLNNQIRPRTEENAGAFAGAGVTQPLLPNNNNAFALPTDPTGGVGISGAGLTSTQRVTGTTSVTNPRFGGSPVELAAGNGVIAPTDNSFVAGQTLLPGFGSNRGVWGGQLLASG
ncbi:MAG: hypothetical protein SFZ03_03990 [Candidatus Melainabacteria bacterium]|nr:hypothetical protein [Candidatus Melainabacteria bacterium]